MFRLIGLILICILMCGSAYAESQTFLDYDKAYSECVKAGKSMILVFGSKNCGTCKRLSDITLSDSDVKAALSDFVLCKLEVYDTESTLSFKGEDMSPRGLTKKMAIKARPTTVFFDIKGNEIERIRGFIPKDTMLSLLTKIKEIRG